MRLVIAGPVGAGKTTFVRTISEIDVVDTDRVATDHTADIKAKTTVAFDFGRINIGDNFALQLYGTPGQERFDFMWDMLIKDAHACIILVAAHRPNEFRYARQIANFMNQRKQIPMVIGITHGDDPEAWDQENIAIAMGLNNEANALITDVDSRDIASVANSIMLIVQQLAQQIAAESESAESESVASESVESQMIGAIA